MSSSSVSSLHSSLSSSPISDVDDLLEELTGLKDTITNLQTRYDALLSQLDAHVRDGNLPVNNSDGITYNSWRFSQSTRKTYTFPPDHPITQREKTLKAERDLAIALGEATEKATTYWTLRKLK